jgi:hypothetical protein
MAQVKIGEEQTGAARDLFQKLLEIHKTLSEEMRQGETVT